MSIALAVFILISLFFLYRRVGFSPGFVASSIFGFSILTFIITEYIKAKNSIIGLYYSHSYKFKESYLEVQYDALFWYSMLYILVYLATILGSQRAVFKSSINTNSIPAGLNFAIVLITYVFFHAMLTKVMWIYDFNEYLILRDPSYYGVTGIFGSLIIRNIGLCGLAASVCLVGYIGKSISMNKLIFAFVFIYCFLYQISNLSRWAPLYLTFISLMLLLRNQHNDSMKSLVIGVFSLIIYTLVIYGRSNETYGLGRILDVDVSTLISYEVFLMNFFTNIFGGLLVFAETLMRTPTQYPIIYKVLSFSPLPSFIDNFSSIRDAEVRINIYGPYNSVAEAYWFGKGYIAFYYVFLMTCIFHIERNWWRSKILGSGIYMANLSFMLMTFGVFMLNQYPLRNSLRWVLLAALIALWSYYIKRPSRMLKLNPLNEK